MTYLCFSKMESKPAHVDRVDRSQGWWSRIIRPRGFWTWSGAAGSRRREQGAENAGGV